MSLTKESGNRVQAVRITPIRGCCAGRRWTVSWRLEEKGILSGVPRDQFIRERERIRQQIELRAWNEHQQSYVSALDGDKIDATLLRLPWYRL